MKKLKKLLVAVLRSMPNRLPQETMARNQTSQTKAKLCVINVDTVDTKLMNAPPENIVKTVQVILTIIKNAGNKLGPRRTMEAKLFLHVCIVRVLNILMMIVGSKMKTRRMKTRRKMEEHLCSQKSL